MIADGDGGGDGAAGGVGGGQQVARRLDLDGELI